MLNVCVISKGKATRVLEGLTVLCYAPTKLARISRLEPAIYLGFKRKTFFATTFYSTLCAWLPLSSSNNYCSYQSSRNLSIEPILTWPPSPALGKPFTWKSASLEQ